MRRAASTMVGAALLSFLVPLVYGITPANAARRAVKSAPGSVPSVALPLYGLVEPRLKSPPEKLVNPTALVIVGKKLLGG